MSDAPAYVIGDVHGQIETLTALLQSAGLVGGDLAWTGGTASLWFVGDYVDRGPDGIGVIDLIMRLGAEARAAGGAVRALLGNHDVMFLAADRFRDQKPVGADVSFLDIWERNGGKHADMDRLDKRHVDWLRRLPAQARVAGNLLQHADSAFYAEYGRGVDGVNKAVARVLQGGDFDAWATLVVKFVRRMEFGAGKTAAAEYLRKFGARRLVHGHTPIAFVGRDLPKRITQPWVYADGLCVNVDGGMFLGEPGFLYPLEQG